MILEELKNLDIPDEPGVYEFLAHLRSDKGKALYIGKATSIRLRVRSYFTQDIHVKRSEAIADMVAVANTVRWHTTDSVLEAMILEANLIKKYQPRYNTLAKDDKSFNYVVITKESFPRVVVVRGKNLKDDYPPPMRKYCFGPFPHGAQLRDAMKLVRKIFPYRDTCTPAQVLSTVSKIPKPCFNNHIGLCPGVCTGDTNAKQYANIIKHITLLFNGHKQKLLKELEREMYILASEERFEVAKKVRNQIYALTHIRDVSLIKDEFRPYGATPGFNRIEAYDAAHLSGTAAVAVMVVVENSEAVPSEYRLFNLKSTTPGDDPGALHEVLNRRLAHDEWPLPQLIVVDGSTAQISVAKKLLAQNGLHIQVVGVVKDEKHNPRELKGSVEIVQTHERDILLANSEAHRFAITKHRRLSRKRL